jgi:hypothetical protein
MQMQRGLLHRPWIKGKQSNCRRSCETCVRTAPALHPNLVGSDLSCRGVCLSLSGSKPQLYPFPTLLYELAVYEW